MAVHHSPRLMPRLTVPGSVVACETRGVVPPVPPEQRIGGSCGTEAKRPVLSEPC